MKRLKTLALTLVSTALLGFANQVWAETQLVMVDQVGCVYCERWDAEIGPAYSKIAEGQFAPLLRANIREGAPKGVTYERRVVFTPTFILTEDGQELARLEGYPGEDFFWPLLGKMLKDHTGFADIAAPATQTN